MINWSNTSNFLIAAFYGLCAIFSFLFIFDAYNHAGQGIVMFRNVDDSTNIVDEADRKNRYSGIFVGFDEACVTKDGASSVSYNDCYKLTPSQDRDLHIIVPITWILLGFAVAHYVLKYVHERDSFPGLFENKYFKVIAFFLFAGPIALFIVSVIWWEYFIQRSQTIVPYKNGEDDHVLNSGGKGAAEFNSVADSYKDTEYWGSGMTSYVWLLLIGQLLQALACIMVLVRNIVMKDDKTFLSFFSIDKEAFGDKLKDIFSSASVGAPVDAAAKKPETKAATQAQVTSVYANRRVTNGIHF
tara:strand:+ start:152 stop:1051 length:900 start_codon:yes stop_codon:yes gene_type:complete